MKRSVRAIAFLLSILMLLPILSITALGAIEERSTSRRASMQ